MKGQIEANELRIALLNEQTKRLRNAYNIMKSQIAKPLMTIDKLKSIDQNQLPILDRHIKSNFDLMYAYLIV